MFRVARNFTKLRYLSSSSRSIDLQNIKLKSKVPQIPVKSGFVENTTRTKITETEMILLERLSLVDLERKEAVKVLEDSIEFASKIQNIDTTDVEPLYTVLENFPLELREDEVTEGKIRGDLMKNAKENEDETYFIAPVGNVKI